jgi:hypothetical protein
MCSRLVHLVETPVFTIDNMLLRLVVVFAFYTFLVQGHVVELQSCTNQRS